MFKTEEYIAPQSFAMEYDSIQNPMMMRIVDNRIFLCNVFTSPIVTIFDSETGKDNGCLGHKGYGKDEFININSMSNIGDTLVLYDNNKSECVLIGNVDSLDNYSRVKIMKNEKVYPFNVIGLEKGILLASGMITDGRFALYGTDGTLLGVFGQYPSENIPNKQNHVSNAFAYQAHVAYIPQTKSLAVGNVFGEGISFYDLSNLSFPKLMKEIQRQHPSYKETSRDNSSSVIFTKENIMGFVDLVSCTDAFIGLYSGEIRERGKSWKGGDKLLIFDKFGNPVKKVNLPQKYIQLSVSGKELYLLGTDMVTDDYVIQKMALDSIIK